MGEGRDGVIMLYVIICHRPKVRLDEGSGAYLSPGRSLTDAEISAASGQSFSTSSRGPQRDLLKPRKDFFTGWTQKR